MFVTGFSYLLLNIHGFATPGWAIILMFTIAFAFYVKFNWWFNKRVDTMSTRDRH
jgi:hypothetical protein